MFATFVDFQSKRNLSIFFYPTYKLQQRLEKASAEILIKINIRILVQIIHMTIFNFRILRKIQQKHAVEF